MPFYEYECPACKYYAEVLQKISDPPLKKCPSCGKAGFKRLMSAPVFRLKGSGWYETDFKSDKEGQRNLAGTEPAGEEPAAKPVAEKPATTEPAKAEGKPAAEKPDAGAARASRSKRPAKPVNAPGRPAAKRAARRPARARSRGGRRR